MDLIALRCTALADKSAQDLNDFMRQFFSAETLLNTPAYKHDASELGRRRMLLLFYLLRSPAYEAGIGRVMANLKESVDGTPGLGWVVPMVAEQVAYYHRTHFYSSAS